MIMAVMKIILMVMKVPQNTIRTSREGLSSAMVHDSFQGSLVNIETIVERYHTNEFRPKSCMILPFHVGIK